MGDVFWGVMNNKIEYINFFFLFFLLLLFFFVFSLFLFVKKECQSLFF